MSLFVTITALDNLPFALMTSKLKVRLWWHKTAFGSLSIFPARSWA